MTPWSFVPPVPDRILRSPPSRRSRAFIPGIPTPARGVSQKWPFGTTSIPLPSFLRGAAGSEDKRRHGAPWWLLSDCARRHYTARALLDPSQAPLYAHHVENGSRQTLRRGIMQFQSDLL